jgi:hypothetical protein
VRGNVYQRDHCIHFIDPSDIRLGWIVVSALLWLIRWTIGSPDLRFSFQWLDFWLGMTERVITMSLVLWPRIKPSGLSLALGQQQRSRPIGEE